MLPNRVALVKLTDEDAYAIVARMSLISFAVVSGFMKQKRAAVSFRPPRVHFVGATRAKPDL